MNADGLELDKALYAALFAASLMALAATFVAVVLGFEMHQRHVVQGEWVAVGQRA